MTTLNAGLVPDSQRQGLWINPEWREGEPGTFGLIIGVSSYPHFRNIRYHPRFRTPASLQVQPPSEAEFPQLEVSARTALTIFRWLQELYMYRGSPLAQCWLLLAPNGAELASEFAADPALAEHVLEPTYANCEAAIWHWHDRLYAARDKTKARAFFYFGGHGLNVLGNNQVLLPTDYANPDPFNPNRALRTVNLRDGLKAAAITEQFFFVDACRSPNIYFTRLGWELHGTDILPPASRGLKEPSARILYASASGLPSYQPKNTPGALSIFGRALNEGLGAPPEVRVCESGPDAGCRVPVDRLHAYVGLRALELLIDLQADDSQQGTSSGDTPPWENPTVTEVPPRTPTGDPPHAEPTAPSGVVPDPLTVYRERVLRRWDNWLATGSGAWRAGERSLDVRVVDLSLEPGSEATVSYALEGVAINPATGVQQAVLTLDGGDGVRWFEVSDGSTRAACLLPVSYANARYQVQLAVRDGRIGELIAAPQAFDILVETADSEWFEAAVDDPRRLAALANEFPVPGFTDVLRAIAGLRSGRPDVLEGWILDLPDQTPWWSDAWILRNEYLMRQGARSEGDEDVVDALLEIRSRGMPITTDALAYAVFQADDCMRLGNFDSERQSRLQLTQQRLHRAAAFATGWGVFSAFAGGAGVLSPGIAGPAQEVAARLPVGV